MVANSSSDGSGAEVLRFRKVLPRHLFVPAIILSAQADLGARLKGLKMGAEDYLGKDSHPQEILARTEQYFCPIKHARKILGTHARYNRFLDYGEAEAYEEKLEEFRIALGKDG